MTEAALAVLQGLPKPPEIVRRHAEGLPSEIVSGSSVPKKIASIHFGMLSAKDMCRLSEVQVINRELYQHPSRTPMPYGPLDERMGTSSKKAECATCGERVDLCPGHFGWIQLQLPVFHVGYIKHIYHILKMICKNCGRVLTKDEEQRQQFFKLVRNRRLDSNKMRDTLKAIMKQCAMISECRFCHEINGDVKKVGPLKFVHRKYIRKQVSAARAEFEAQFETSIAHNPELKPYISKAEDDLHPTRVHKLFSRILPEECELVGMHHRNARPEWMILQAILVPPCAIRPSVVMDTQGGSNEDDLTMKIAEIITMNNIIKADMDRGQKPDQMMDRWDYLQQQVAMLINSEHPGLPMQPGAKPMRGLCQRLKGKQGRFRGNLSGKRVDFSSRTVISPDPNLKITEVGVPLDVAMILTYPEPVFEHNLEKMRKLVLNGPDVHPGARYVATHDGFKISLKVADRKKVARNLKVGDIVERHLMDGDVCLFNRQPSLHRVSIMAHRARVMQWKTFRFNECCCTPYNADFDGDEMNLHLPQTVEARAEALELMSVGRNLAVPKSGELLIAATQDFLTASWLLTSKDRFFTQDEFCQIIAGSLGMTPGQRIDLPEPAILKPIRLYTGKQIFSVLIQPNRDRPFPVNMEMKLRNYDAKANKEYLDDHDCYMVIREGELLCGQLDKSALGGGKTTLFAYLLKQFDWETAADRMSKVAQMCARFTGNYGISIGISDVMPSANLSKKKEQLISSGYKKCDRYIADYVMGNMDAEPGCTMEQTLESILNRELSEIRDAAGKLCIDELITYDKHNSPLIMTLCGSKGSKINISQMVACVGQQTLSGQRIPNGFANRTLPHFEINSKDPPAKGFVANSFYTGLTPTEFFFHTMGGREGLVDTAVKTAETGYMQRRLMKALEDLSVQYDNTVRGSTGQIIQFTYGDDGVEPTLTEADEAPYDLNRQWIHCQIAFKSQKEEPSLLPDEIMQLVEEKIANTEIATWPEKPIEDLRKFFSNSSKTGLVDRLSDLRRKLGLSNNKDDNVDPQAQKNADQLMRITRTQVEEFFKSIIRKRNTALVDPGTAVGALCGQSIGEPCTQMTLKTFHFAGVASMNITLGVPRIREIINATKKISTPIIKVALQEEHDLEMAKIVRGRIEKTTLSDVAEYIKEVYTPNTCCLMVKIDFDRVQDMFLAIDIHSIRESILNAKKLKLKPEHVAVTGKKLNKIIVKPPENFSASRAKDSIKNSYFTIQALKLLLPKVVVSGLESVNRCVIRKTQDGKGEKYNLLVEGDDLLGVMTQRGVDPYRTTSNHTLQIFKTLGIEAARRSIVDEIMYTMSSHGVGGDPRHLHLLADCMTYKGEVLGITRFGISKMKDSVLMLASFERTTDYLFDAGQRAVVEPITGVSECIIMGRPIPLGTGLFKVILETETGLVERGRIKLPPRPTFFGPTRKFADFRKPQQIPAEILARKAQRWKSDRERGMAANA